ncbi:hypothetical protein CHU95_02235 [Niveispirillum lacus]|uniref:Uncharacterized protein n=1 Tax=Niveispirillum lacus TaxID=1981099 RepID=A0A255Z6L7_9PROT|nr:tetratricopeptide repeat protein [Niveispirillum lacus]OYQ37187.1 hypothetical protein CHU95_02235 [Niveispirillum lacus]
MLPTLQTARSLLMDGQDEAALDMLESLARSGAATPDALFLLGAQLRQAGRTAEAIPFLEQVFRERPDMTNSLAELGYCLAEVGRKEEALEVLREVVRRVPGHSCSQRLGQLLAGKGIYLVDKGDDLQGVPLLQEAMAALGPSPDLAAALAMGRHRLGDNHGALSLLQDALSLWPDHPACLVNLSSVLDSLSRHVEAEAACRRVLDHLVPDLPQAHCNLGAALRGQGRLEEAEAAFRRAHELDPTLVPVLANLGTVMSSLGRLEDSAVWYRKAIDLAPDDMVLTFLIACDRLKAGDWAEGWARYELRNRHPANKVNWTLSKDLPRWEGGDPAGLRILLEEEQGYGDRLQFFRFARLLADRGATVGIATLPGLHRLFRQSDPRILLVDRDTAPSAADWDFGMPLMSLPHRFGTRVDTVPGAPYLTAEPGQAAAWAERLAGLTGLRVGLVWAGDSRPHDPSANGIDRRRSMSLAQFAPLAAIPGVHLISLQKGEPAAQVADAPFPLLDWTGELDDFADTAALAVNLDMVVSVDTAPAHLAAALGVPVLLLSRFDGCWRWLHGRDDTPWYPTMRLFRQQSWGDWSAPLAGVTAAVAAAADAKSRA